MKYSFLFVISFLSAASYGQSQSKKFSFELDSEYSLPEKSGDLSFQAGKREILRKNTGH
jgi:hypothetical protein